MILANAGSFFAAGNNNYFDGAATTLQSSSLDTACKMLRTMVDDQSRLIDIQPRVLLIPSDLETTARELLNSSEVLRYETSDDRLPTGNRWRDFVSLAVEPRLGISSYTGYSTTALYLTGGPQDGLAIMAFLNGRTSPTIETADVDFNTLGIQMRCFLDVGCKLSDPRAGIKSKGAA